MVHGKVVSASVVRKCLDARVDVDELEEELKKLRQELDEHKQQYLRVLAEYDNFRKRSVKERLDASADATAKAALEVISVIDTRRSDRPFLHLSLLGMLLSVVSVNRRFHRPGRRRDSRTTK